jgi:hypothetical protein
MIGQPEPIHFKVELAAFVGKALFQELRRFWTQGHVGKGGEGEGMRDEG